MSRKVSDFFTKMTTGSELTKAEVKLESGEDETKSNGNLTSKNEDKLNKNIKTEAEQQHLVILPQQKIEKLPIPIKIEKIEPIIDNLQCHVCKNIFKTAATLRVHKLIHNKIFQCKICNKNYPKISTLQKHIKNVHENPGSFKCQFCSTGFNTKDTLKSHQKIHNPDRPKPFKCGKCEFATDNNSTFKNHLKTHDRNIERCDKCNKILQKNKTHDCSLNCKFCGQKFSHRITVLKHIRNVHPHETDREFFECDICGLKMNRKSMFVQHMKVKHADRKPQIFKCDLDGKTFKLKDKIVQHMKSHLPPVKCDFCDLKVSVRNLKGHIKNLHTGIKYPRKKLIPKIKTFECPMCYKILTTKPGLKRHVSSHDKTIKCKFCDKLFGCKLRLREHVKNYHENPEGHSCEICEKMFMQLSNLRSHIKIHLQVRPRNFKCTICDFATFKQINLEKHLNYHKKSEGVLAIHNLHKCPKCPSTFRAKKNWHEHMYKVHPKILVECDICGIKMMQKSDILSHIRGIHKIGIENVRK